MKSLKINYAAVLVLVLLHQIIGAIWYSPFGFAEKWMSLSGNSMSDFENASFAPYVVSIIASVITNFIMAYLFIKLDVRNFAKGIYYAFLFWLGFLFVELLTFNSFSLRPFGLTFIDAGKSLVTFLVSGFLLGMWTKYNEDTTAESK